jgi:hypothetical protein
VGVKRGFSQWEISGLRLFDHWVLSWMFGCTGNEITGNLKLLSKELPGMCCAPNITRVMKPRRMKETGQVPPEEKKNSEFSSGKT